MTEEIKLEGAKAELKGSELTISGKLGSTKKTVNTKFIRIEVSGDAIKLTPVESKKLTLKAKLATQALGKELRDAVAGVQKGIEKKMTILSAHFPMSFEIKNGKFYIKNIFGEKTPRHTSIVGSTKIEVKGTDVKVSGVDPYDVGQTIANIRKLCNPRGHDSRVFQDGLYLVREE